MLSYFKNKKILITGHTGFKGSWLSLWLNHLGAQVVGVSDVIPTNPSHFETTCLEDKINDIRCDLTNLNDFEKIINEIKPDLIFHLAAQSLVRKSYTDPVTTFKTNLFGTVNLLESLRKYRKECNVIIITSDKCYENLEWEWGYKETDKLGGADPYSASKATAEIAMQSYVKSFFKDKNNHIKICSVRAGNVIGGGDWAKDRIVPDFIKAWQENNIIKLRNPKATRPWQHVLEPLSGYLLLSYKLSKNNNLHGEAFNFGPNAKYVTTVEALVKKLSLYLSGSKYLIEENDQLYESGLLKLNCDKAINVLGWSSVLDFDETIEFIAEWYDNYYKKSVKTYDITINQILKYTDLAKNRGLEWFL